ncbi:hypothetical protein Rs2_06661 [Raphanus sativus]|uniref:Protein transport protein SEC31 isoform X2 n=1 Tax=Raphanus sativus TaxID=3726 RepID=A0A6J0MJK5_RAPSA|nr:protein transport protein SEC31 isoform X2 [Raphanus sativus]KAJ4912040.1 hypothetical protein Rs2_06661 [Raphanus sativus]
MNTTLFSDKQIMDLMNDNNSNDGDHQRLGVGDNDLASKKEAIVPSYDFQPIRPNSTVGLSHSALDLAGSVNSTGARVWGASDVLPVPTSSARSYGSLDSLELSKLFAEKKERVNPETVIISEIDRALKKHTDNLLHVMEGVSARLTQLESRTRNLENLVDDVKVSVGNSHGNTDGKMRQLENIMLEVQSGVQLLKDKQEILEAQLQLSKLQVSKAEQHSDKHSTHVEPTAQPPAAPSQPQASAAAPPSLTQQGLPPQQFIQQLPSQHSLPAPSSQLPQLPSQFPPQQESYFSPPGGGQSQPPPVNNPPYQPPPPRTHQPPYQTPPQQPQYPQQPPPQLQQPSSGYNQEEPPYPLQSYPSNPPRQQPPPAPAPSQQYFNGPPTPPSMYDGPGGRSSSGFPSGYSPEPYPYTTPPSSQFGNTQSLKPSHQSGGGGGSGYPQIPMARPLPQALPMATAISSGGSGGGSGSPRAGSNVPVDDVIDKVSSMGFPRDQVRGTVRSLTENGQAVDLNTVLDKLMNGGVTQQQQQQQPPRGWFGGR